MKTEYTEEQIKDLKIVLSQAENTIDGFYHSIKFEMEEVKNNKTTIDGLEIDKKEEIDQFMEGMEILEQLCRVLKIQQSILDGSEIDPDSIKFYDEFHQTIDNS